MSAVRLAAARFSQFARAVYAALAVLGLALVIAATVAWLTRDSIAAWYRTLPVVFAAKCTPNEGAR